MRGRGEGKVRGMRGKCGEIFLYRNPDYIYSRVQIKSFYLYPRVENQQGKLYERERERERKRERESAVTFGIFLKGK